MKDITPAEMLKRLEKEDIHDEYGVIPITRMYCEWFLNQRMANGSLPYTFGNHDRRWREYDRIPEHKWDTPNHRLDGLYLFSSVNGPIILETETIIKIVWAHISGEKLPAPVQIYRSPKYHRCGQCDENYHLWTDGLKVWSPFTCPFPDGCPEYYHDFDFPSGKIVIENDSRSLFPPQPEDLGGEGTVWAMNITKFYAKHGLAHFFVGNTCPGVYEVGKDEYIIAPNPVDKDYNDLNPEGWKRHAAICTDLWWYSITDYDKYIELGGKISKHHNDVMNITPGRYRFTHQYHLVRDVGGLEEIYTRITKIS